MSSPDRQIVLKPDSMFYHLCCCDNRLTKKKGQILPCTSILHLPDELLLEIFDCLRLEDEYEWNHTRRWYNLLHACRNWRYIMLESASRLKLYLFCDIKTPTPKMLKHSPPLPLIVDVNSIYLDPDSSNNVIHALQHPGRVVSISIDTWAIDCWELLEAPDKTFPALETFSLLVALSERPNRQTLHFPEKFISPRLHTL